MIESSARAAKFGIWPVFVFLLAILAASRAHSAERALPSGSAYLSAVSAGETWRQPSGITIETRDTDLDGVHGPRVEAVRDAIRQALTEQGIAVTEDGFYVLHFRVSSVPNRSPAADGEGVASWKPPPGERYRRVDVVDQVTVPLRAGNGAEISSDFAISFMLFVPGEEPLWNARITASGEVEDPVMLLRGMTRAAMSALGTSEERHFALSCADDATVKQGSSCLP